MDARKQESEGGSGGDERRGAEGANKLHDGRVDETDHAIQQRIINLQKETHAKRLTALAKARQVKKEREDKKKAEKRELEEKQKLADMETELLVQDMEAKQEQEKKRRGKKRKHAHPSPSSSDSDSDSPSLSGSDDEPHVHRPSKKKKRESGTRPADPPLEPPGVLQQASNNILRVAGDALHILVGTGLVSFAYAAVHTFKPMILTMVNGRKQTLSNPEDPSLPIPTDNSAWFRE